MKRSDVPFKRLRAVLEGLGFKAHRKKSGWLFDHPSSPAVFLFRQYRPSEQVFAIDLVAVRSQLDWRGMMDGEAFDSMLTKTPA